MTQDMTPDDSLWPDEAALKQFVRDHLRTVWALELLFLLHASGDRGWWTIDQLIVDLRGSAALVETSLADLSRGGLIVAQDGGYRFGPASPVLERLVERLAQVHAQRPFTLIRWIATPPERLQGLADAFKFKREDP